MSDYEGFALRVGDLIEFDVPPAGAITATVVADVDADKVGAGG